MLGLSLATAVFLDATLVQLVLAPKTMEPLGNARRWLRSLLDRTLPMRCFVRAAPVNFPVGPERGSYLEARIPVASS